MVLVYKVYWILLSLWCLLLSKSAIGLETTKIVSSSAKPPNIVVFFIANNGFHSNRIISDETIVPSLKHLAENGIILDSCYASPDSASTLSSFFAGKNIVAAFDHHEEQHEEVFTHNLFAYLHKILYSPPSLPFFCPLSFFLCLYIYA